MADKTLRSIACLMAMLVLGAASTLSVRSAPTSTAAQSVTRAATPVSASAGTRAARTAGRGWGALFGCVGCGIAGALIIAGGPGSILIAVNTPGSSIALLACVGTCYEVLAS